MGLGLGLGFRCQGLGLGVHLQGLYRDLIGICGYVGLCRV